MKRHASIPVLLVATLILMVVSVLPHHHHAGMIYLATAEHCMQDNGLHGRHDPCNDSRDCKDGCFTASGYLPCSQKDLLVKAQVPDRTVPAAPAVFTEAAGPGLPGLFRPAIPFLHRPCPTASRQAGFCRSISLRAPPCVLS